MNKLTEIERTVDKALEAATQLIREIEITQESILIAIKFLQDAKEENDRILARYEDFLNKYESARSV